MLFSKRLRLANLIELCRALRHNLGAGLPVVKVVRQQASRGPAAARPVAARISLKLEQGESLEAALEEEKQFFPPLFLALAGVGERTGNLPEMFGELEKYYVLQQKLWRRFLGQIWWPVFQFVAATLVIALLLFILGMVAETRNENAPDTLGVGLTGASGALRFLVVIYGSLAALVGTYLVLQRVLQHQAVDLFLLRVPVVGPCLRSLAMMRFCLALGLTLETGMPIMAAIRLSFRATGNPAFAAHSDAVAQRLRAGTDLTLALAEVPLFTEEFHNILAVAEESGRVPEVMRQQAAYYEEEAGRRLSLATRAAGFVVWLVVAGFIITAIFLVFTSYLQQINNQL